MSSLSLRYNQFKFKTLGNSLIVLEGFIGYTSCWWRKSQRYQHVSNWVRKHLDLDQFCPKSLQTQRPLGDIFQMGCVEKPPFPTSVRSPTILMVCGSKKMANLQLVSRILCFFQVRFYQKCRGRACMDCLGLWIYFPSWVSCSLFLNSCSSTPNRRFNTSLRIATTSVFTISAAHHWQRIVVTLLDLCLLVLAQNVSK